MDFIAAIKEKGNFSITAGSAPSIEVNQVANEACSGAVALARRISGRGGISHLPYARKKVLPK